MGLNFLISLPILICGYIIDSTNHTPVPSAIVNIDSEYNQRYVTDGQGKVCFEVKTLPVQIRIQRVGYQTTIATVSDSTFKFFIHPKEITSEEVVINAVRADELVPVTQKLISKSEIQNGYTGQEMPVVLSKSPSITWYSDGGHFTGYSYMRLRGMDQTRINFTLNGMPLNEPEDQGAYFSNYPDFLNSIQSIQIQRGVGTSTNGTSSYAGSVNLESVNLNDTSHVQIQSSYGSFGTYRISPSFHSGLLKNKFSIYGRYSLTGTQGYRYHSGNQGNSFFLSCGYFTPKGLLKLTTFAGNSKSDLAYLATSKEDIGKDSRTNYLSPDEKDDFSQYMAQLQYTQSVSRNVNFTATAYYNYLNGYYKVLSTPIMYSYAVQSDFYGGILNLEFKRKNLSLNSGIHLNGYQRHHYLRSEPFVSQNVYSNTGFKNEGSAFLKATYNIGKFILYGDIQLRLINFSYQGDQSLNQSTTLINWVFLNPKAGITYQYSHFTSYYFSVGKTSREPTRNDMFAGYDNLDSTNFSQIGDFSRVKPETVLDFELGMTLKRSNFQLQANLFDMEFQNEIAAIGQLSYIGLPLRKNVDRSSRRGIEIDLDLRFFKKWQYKSNLTVSQNTIYEYRTDYDSVNYKNVQPLLTPPIILNQSLIYNLGKSNLEVNARYLGKSYLDNTQNENFIVPQSFVLNASVNIKVLSHLSFQLMVNNLLDTQYFTSGYVQNSSSYYYSMAGRNYFGTLRIDF